MAQGGDELFSEMTITAPMASLTHASIDVTIVADSVQLSKDGQVIRLHPIRHDRAKELGAFPPVLTAERRRKNSAPGMSLSYRNSSVTQVPELDTRSQPQDRRQVECVRRGHNYPGTRPGLQGGSPAAYPSDLHLSGTR